MHRFDCTVIDVTTGATGALSLRVLFSDGVIAWIPSSDAKKIETSKEDDEERHYPKSFSVGDLVDAKFQDRQKWYRGRVAQVRDNGTCDIMYYDSGDVSSSAICLKIMRFILCFLIYSFLSMKQTSQRTRKRFVSVRVSTQPGNGYKESRSC